VTAEARAEGLKVGVLRPITLYPFPVVQFQRLAFNARVFCGGGDEQRPDA
jgi:pyruvate/2-oxoacid:ferredoxin oxidoreductase alpha subunit